MYLHQTSTLSAWKALVRRCVSVGLGPFIRLSRTRTNYWLGFVLDTALGIGLLGGGLEHRIGPSVAVYSMLLGLLAFTFIEYVFHRWLFHGSLRLMARGHATHHRNPRGYDSLPFFVPAALVCCIAGMLILFLPIGDAEVLASGIAFGNVAYGLSHFTIHHWSFKNSLMRFWAMQHHLHHRHANCNFGVTIPFWDALLGTRYVATDASRGGSDV